MTFANTRSAPPWILLIAVALALGGCVESKTSSTKSAPSAPTPRASVALTVMVVNDPELAEAIKRLRGEWIERTGGTLAVVSCAWSDVAKSDKIDADIVVFPARNLGELVEAKRLRPMRVSTISSKSYDVGDVLPLAREKLGTYSRQVMALPLSVEMPMVGMNHKSLTDWPALELLARSAAYATHPRQEAALFDPQTMAARIAEPPFVRALEEWQAEEKAAADSVDSSSKQNKLSEFPSAEQVFNRSTGTWEAFAGGAHQVPLLAGGTLLAVTASTRNAASAFDLAAWLAGAEISRQLVPVGKGALPVRQSQLGSIGKWFDVSSRTTENSQLASALQRALSRSDALMVPRIPGTDEYLGALATAVEKALTGKTTAADALAEAARRWDQITDRLGRDSQRQAYLHDLGIDEP